MMFCFHGLKSLGYETTWVNGQLDSDAINVVFGSYVSEWKTLSAAAPHIIIYNWEQVSPDVPWFNLAYYHQLKNAQVWDYSQKNITALNALGINDVERVTVGYCPELSEISNQPSSAETAVVQDIDVLFYGTMSQRRALVLDAIRARGLNVVSSESGQMMGEHRSAMIARAKVVLNVHYYETVGIFEIARVSYLLANHKAVVSELSPQTDIEPDIKDAIVSGSIDELPELCWQLVHDDARRTALEQKGFEIFSRRKAEAILQPAIDKYLARLQNPLPVEVTSLPTPQIINIGAGLGWRFDALNIDVRDDFSPDITLDFNLPIPFDQPLASLRFGVTTLSRGAFNKIIANNVFQCSEDLIQTLTNCLDLLEDGGLLELEIPYDLSYGAWSKANTKRTFNEQTWGKLLNEWWQYGWQTHRFDCVNQQFMIVHPFGFESLKANDHNWEKVLKIPRAIDALKVYLRKRPLTTEELRQLPQTKFLG
jgi:hypothetical protein